MMIDVEDFLRLVAVAPESEVQLWRMRLLLVMRDRSLSLSEACRKAGVGMDVVLRKTGIPSIEAFEAVRQRTTTLCPTTRSVSPPHSVGALQGFRSLTTALVLATLAVPLNVFISRAREQSISVEGIRVETSPERQANVTVGGREVGKTPLVLARTRKDQVVRIEYLGIVMERMAGQVGDGKVLLDLELSGFFVPELTVMATPDDAIVFLNGVRQGMVPQLLKHVPRDAEIMIQSGSQTQAFQLAEMNQIKDGTLWYKFRD